MELRILDRAAVLGAEDLPCRPLDVPEWGGRVFIKMLTAGERDQLEASLAGNCDRDVRARFAAATVCDESGALLFGAGDIAALSAKSGRALDRVFAAATKHNAMSKQDIDELKKNC